MLCAKIENCFDITKIIMTSVSTYLIPLAIAEILHAHIAVLLVGADGGAYAGVFFAQNVATVSAA